MSREKISNIPGHLLFATKHHEMNLALTHFNGITNQSLLAKNTRVRLRWCSKTTPHIMFFVLLNPKASTCNGRTLFVHHSIQLRKTNLSSARDSSLTIIGLQITNIPRCVVLSARCQKVTRLACVFVFVFFTDRAELRYRHHVLYVQSSGPVLQYNFQCPGSATTGQYYCCIQLVWLLSSRVVWS